MKKLRTLSLCACAFCLTGCWTSIWTSAPTTETVVPVNTVYTTQVSGPSYPTTTTTIKVTTYNDDLSFYLDLQAVAAAFAESRSVEEFERIINSSRYMINNLDLNRDGYVDYLRVIEVRQGYYHTFLLQACLGPQMFQDIATLVAERRSDRLYVEVIGDYYLYGHNYVVRPVFIQRPPLWDYFGRPHYNPWVSPYYHGHWPSYYTYTRPVYLNHYQAYVNTYMTNHHYCHRCDYPNQPYWDGYRSMTQSHCHHDYANQHPNESFDKRIEHNLTPNGTGVTYRNAGQLREGVARSQQNSANQSGSQPRVSQNTGSTPRPTQSVHQSSSFKPNNSQAATNIRTSQSQTAQPSTRASQTTTSQSGTSTRSSQNTATSQPSTRTSQTVTTQSGASIRTSQNTATSQPYTRSSQSSQSAQSSNRSSVNSATSKSSVRQPSTNVSSRVSRTGEVKATKIQTTDANGKTTTTTRSSGASTRSSGTRTSSTSSSKRQSSSSGSSSSSSSSRQSGSSSNGGGRSSGNSGSAPRR